MKNNRYYDDEFNQQDWHSSSQQQNEGHNSYLQPKDRNFQDINRYSQSSQQNASPYRNAQQRVRFGREDYYNNRPDSYRANERERSASGNYMSGYYDVNSRPENDSYEQYRQNIQNPGRQSASFDAQSRNADFRNDQNNNRGRWEYNNRQHQNESQYLNGYNTSSGSRYSIDDSYRREKDYRTWWDRTTDKVASWLGDEDARRRRHMDERSGPHRGKGPKGYVRSDERIKDDIYDRLINDPYIDASEIDIEVQNGEVILKGSTHHRGAKRRAEDLIESVLGVKHVENRLKVN